LWLKDVDMIRDLELVEATAILAGMALSTVLVSSSLPYCTGSQSYQQDSDFIQLLKVGKNLVSLARWYLSMYTTVRHCLSVKHFCHNIQSRLPE
jgi:hypothetical protein